MTEERTAIGWWHTLPTTAIGLPKLRIEDGRLVKLGQWMSFRPVEGRFAPECGVVGMHASSDIMSAIEWSSCQSNHMRLCRVDVVNNLHFDDERHMVAGEDRIVREWIDLDSITKEFAERLVIPEEVRGFVDCNQIVADKLAIAIYDGTSPIPMFVHLRRMLNRTVEMCHYGIIPIARRVVVDFRQQVNGLLLELWDKAEKLD